VRNNASYPQSVWQRSKYRPDNPADQAVFEQWRLGFFVLYAAVALLLVGLAMADRPGTVTIASARLGQATDAIEAGRHFKLSDRGETTACRGLTC
jgi:hypothetical protein